MAADGKPPTLPADPQDEWEPEAMLAAAEWDNSDEVTYQLPDPIEHTSALAAIDAIVKAAAAMAQPEQKVDMEQKHAVDQKVEVEQKGVVDQNMVMEAKELGDRKIDVDEKVGVEAKVDNHVPIGDIPLRDIDPSDILGGDTKIDDADRALVAEVLQDPSFAFNLRALRLNIKDMAKIVSNKSHGVVFIWKVDKKLGCPICPQVHKTIRVSVSRQEKKVNAFCTSAGKRVSRRLGQISHPQREDVPEKSGLPTAEEFYERAVSTAYTRADSDRYPMMRYDPYDPYMYSDYVTEMCAFTAVDEVELAIFAMSRINRVMAYIAPSEYVVKRSQNELFYFVKGVPPFVCKMVTRIRNKVKVVDVPHSTIVKTILWYSCLNMFRSKVVEPGRDFSTVKFNMWPGIKAEKVWHQVVYSGTAYSEKPEEVTRIKLFIREWICEDNDVLYNAFMKVLVETVKRPWKKLPWAIWMYSPEKRLGKSLFIKFLTDHVLGQQIVKNFNGLASMLNQHNGWVIAKKLVVVEECSTTKEEFLTMFDQLKSIISDSMISVNPKYQNQFDVQNFALVWLITNHLNALLLEFDDRRYLCLKATVPEHIKDKKTFLKELSEAILNDDVGLAFWKYLCETEEFDEVDPYNEDPPISSVKKDILDQSLMPEVKFVSELGLYRVRLLLVRKIGDCKKKLEGKLPEVEIKELTQIVRVFEQYLEDIGAPIDPGMPMRERDLASRLQEEAEKKIFTSGELYDLYNIWYTARLTEDPVVYPPVKSAGALSKIHFCRRIQTAIGKSRRGSAMQNRCRGYDIDLVHEMYINCEAVKHIREAAEDVMANVDKL